MTSILLRSVLGFCRSLYFVHRTVFRTESLIPEDGNISSLCNILCSEYQNLHRFQTSSNISSGSLCLDVYYSHVLLCISSQSKLYSILHFLMVPQPLVWISLPCEFPRSHSDTPHWVGLLWTSDRPVAETSAWQHSIFTTDHTLVGFEPAILASERPPTITQTNKPKHRQYDL
jgi:hypothetical protein